MDRDEILERRCARLARVAARAADPRARRAARPALAGLLATVSDDATQNVSTISVLQERRRLRRRPRLPRPGTRGEDPAGIDDLVATALRDRFASMDKDADAGYDALVLNLDAHVAVAALARRVALAGPGKLPASVAALRDDGAAARRGAARSRLRRAVAAPNVGRETVPATTGSADEPAKPGRARGAAVSAAPRRSRTWTTWRRSVLRTPMLVDVRAREPKRQKIQGQWHGAQNKKRKNRTRVCSPLLAAPRAYATSGGGWGVGSETASSKMR